MRASRLWILKVLMIVGASVTCAFHVAGAASDADAGVPVLINGHRVHPTRLLAKLRTGNRVSAATATLKSNGVAPVHSYAFVPGLVLLDETPGSVVTAASVGANSTPDDGDDRATPLLARIQALSRTGLFEYVEPDFYVSTSAEPTDAAFADGSLWGLRNLGQNGGTAGVDIDAVRAWDVTTGSAQVVVAVIDSGVRYTHRDLARQMWRNPDETAGNGVDDDANGYVDDIFGIDACTLYTNQRSGDPVDVFGHGSHVAGTIGAAANRGADLVGVAWGVRIMACRFIDDEGNGVTSDALVCIEYAVAKGARILNCSWGGGAYSRSLRDSFAAAGRADVLVVASAGNSSTNIDEVPDFPACFTSENILSVAAVDRQGALAPFSNFGRNHVHVAAPGVAILSCAGLQSDSAMLVRSGTSMAAPHVSGVAALALSRHPDLTVGELHGLLLRSVSPLDGLKNNTSSGGCISAFMAVSAEADGALELSASPVGGSTLHAGTKETILARVSDLYSATNAAVVGSTANGPDVIFRDDGVFPDLTPQDGVYSAEICVPATTECLPLTIRASAPGKTGATLPLSFEVEPEPANNDFEMAESISGPHLVVHGSNRGATQEPGEPLHGEHGGASVWWTWTAPADCTVDLSTQGSSINTLLAVYEGAALGGLRPIVANDDAENSVTSRVSFAASAGTAYRIAIDGYDGLEGELTLVLSTSLPPVNDRFVDRLPLSGEQGSVEGTVLNATREMGEPEEGVRFYGSVWYRWTAPANGTATFALRSDTANFALAVYVGSEVDALTNVPGLDQNPYTRSTRRRFVASAGTTYQIAVWRSGTAPDYDFTLDFSFAVPPDNDAFASRRVLTGPSVLARGTNLGATHESGEPVVDGGSYGAVSVWWTWTAPVSGTATVRAMVDDAWTLLGVFTGPSLAGLQRVAESDNDAFDTMQGCVVFPVEAGVTYQLVVDGAHGGCGPIELSIEVNPPPLNDAFAGRQQLVGLPVLASGTNAGATVESIDTARMGGMHAFATVWWTWTAPATTSVVFSTEGSEIDTILAVNRRSPTGGWILVGANDDLYGAEDGHSYLACDVTEGETYEIIVDGKECATGAITLGIARPTHPPNDPFAQATQLEGTQISASGSNIGATGEEGEQLVENQRPSKSVWWVWTAPAAGRATVDTTGSEMDCIVNVFTGDQLSSLITEASNFVWPRITGRNAGWDAVAGATYHIAVQGLHAATGDIALRLSFENAPANDEFVGREMISGWNAVVRGSNLGATRDDGWSGYQEKGLVPGAPVWWRWTPPSDGIAVISTEGSSFDSIVAALTGSALENLALIQCSNEAPQEGLTNRIVIPVTAGTEYQLVVDGFGGARGDIQLRVDLCEPVSNDALSSASILVGADVVAQGSNQGATAEALEPSHSFVGPFASVWWAWTAPADGLVALTTTAADFEPVVAVYTGAALSDLEHVATCAEEGGVRGVKLLTFTATAGVTYLFAVDGVGGAMGRFSLNLETRQPPGAPDCTGGGVYRLGEGIQLAATASGEGPFAYQWFRGGFAVPGATLATLEIPFAQYIHSGDYTVEITDRWGSTRSVALTVTVEAQAISPVARLLNLSTRALCLTGDDVLIPSFVVGGSGTKRLLLRAVGPELVPFGIVAPLPDPRIVLKRRVGDDWVDHATNDDWGANANAVDIIAAANSVYAFDLSEGSKSSALLLDLPAGQYTAIASDTGSGSGIAIVELYDLDAVSSSTRLVNIANRGYVGTGNDLMIPGFVVSAEGPKTLLIRAVGPTLSSFGVTGVLSDPQLAIHRREVGTPTDQLILTNDNWGENGDAPEVAATAERVYAFALPSGGKDAALVVTLTPGIYTVHASGAGEATGVALVEVYVVP